MGKKLYEENNIQAVANAIRQKNGGSTKYKVSEMPSAILAIETGSDVSGVTATADKVLDGSVFVDSTGAEVEGTMPNNGAFAKTMDGIDTKSVSIPKGYTEGGTVSLTDDIENIADEQTDLISQIQTALEGKAAGGITPTGTIEITENGTHDVTNYASALVNVASSGGSVSVTTQDNINLTVTAGPNTSYSFSAIDTDGLIGAYIYNKTVNFILALDSTAQPGLSVYFDLVNGKSYAKYGQFIAAWAAYTINSVENNATTTADTISFSSMANMFVDSNSPPPTNYKAVLIYNK